MKTLHENFRQSQKQERKRIQFLQLFLLVALFATWEITTHYRLLDPLIFSSPLAVSKLFVSKIVDGTLYVHVLVTLFETIIGFILGTLLGTLFAFGLWSSHTAAKVLDPYLVVLNAMPKVAIGPIILVIFGPTIFSVLVMGVLISVVISTIVIFSAFQQVNKNYVKVMELFQASRMQTFQHVILPASVPSIISTLKVNVGLSWVGVIVGEFLVSSQGLGYLIISGFQIFNFNLVFLALCIIVIMATIMYKMVENLEKVLLRKLNYHA
ncbi:ABC transporter permease [Paenisporosarcina cavernae]